MDSDLYEITATVEQMTLLNGPKSIESLKVADFLAKQDYIDDWIQNWLVSTNSDLSELPLCVENTLFCDTNMMKIYKESCRAAVMRNDLKWLQLHLVIPFSNRIWNFVEFTKISDELFDFMWERTPTPGTLADFVSYSKNMHIWKKFTLRYNLDYCVNIACKQGWIEGVTHCIEEGCGLEQIISDSLKYIPIFQIVASYNPTCTAEDYQQFLLQKMMGRIKVEHIPIVEEYFFIHGFHEEEFEHNLEF
jgi:hypothetical protein